MLKYTPKECRGAFLLKFTEQIIKSTKSAQLFRLEETLKEILPEGFVEEEKEKRIILTKDEIKEKVKEALREKPPAKKDSLKDITIPSKRSSINTIEIIKDQKRVLRIPEPKLPPTMSYLKPTLTEEILDLKRLNVLIQDLNINMIECEGPNLKIIVNGSMGRKNTEITLTQEEIDEILAEFSMKSRIPISDGITKLVVGSLILISTKTKDQPTKFTIKKMTKNPQFIPSSTR